MSLQEKLDAFKADFKAGKLAFKAPPEVHATMARGTAELIASGQAERALKIGDKAPEFTLDDPDGKPVSSAEMLSHGPLIISFYRGVWCPFCNMEMQALEEALSSFRAAGASLIAISPQSGVNSRKSMRTNELNFPILSDPGNTVAASFGIRFKLPDYLIELYKGFGNDLPAVNGDDSWTLPMPARYAIGRDGKILYAEVNPDYTRRPEPEDLLQVLGAELAQAH